MWISFDKEGIHSFSLTQDLSHLADDIQQDHDEPNIFVIGGNIKNLQECKVYDVKTEKWKKIAATNQPRLRSRAIVLNSRIFVAGGQWDKKPLSSIEIYNPFENCWTLNGQMSTPLFGHSMAVLDGDIYVAGGNGLLVILIEFYKN